MNHTVFSVVLPVLNEIDNIPELYDRVTKVMRQEGASYEIIFVNDGSTDQSEASIRRLHQQDPCVKLVNLSRNFGHQMALSAGMSVATGRAVICMDSDLQDAPEILPEFIARWREGYDVVYAIRETRKEGILKKTAYTAFYRILKQLSNIEIPLDSGDFSLMDRRVVDLINRLPERARFIRGLRAWVGFKQIGVSVHRDARMGGQPKYGPRQLINLAIAGLISFSVVPLRLAITLGMIVSSLSFISIVLVCCLKLFTTFSLPGFAATASILLFLGGVQLLTVGILGEYVGRIFDEVKGRPLFVIADLVGMGNEQDNFDRSALSFAPPAAVQAANAGGARVFAESTPAPVAVQTANGGDAAATMTSTATLQR